MEDHRYHHAGAPQQVETGLYAPAPHVASILSSVRTLFHAQTLAATALTVALTGMETGANLPFVTKSVCLNEKKVNLYQKMPLLRAFLDY